MKQIRCIALVAVLILLPCQLALAKEAEEATNSVDAEHGYQVFGVRDSLPIFYQRLGERLTFPLAWNQWRQKNGDDFDRWRGEARQKTLECFLTPPPAVPFEPKVIGSRQRDGYTSHKLTIHLTGDSLVLGYLLVPDGAGPHPAVLLLHDHGAEFRIGKEKVVEPWDDNPQRMQWAREWVDTCYGGRFFGDELAKRGYVCFVTDALNWSDRGGAGYDGQQALSSNLMHLGTSLSGTIAHEDLRAAEFLASRPEVDKHRIAAMGLSMGSFRTWQVTAMSEHISAGAAICWMATIKGLMVPGNNHVGGNSAYTMLHPNLCNHLDYPDVASIACPKPMLFYGGLKDHLFPVASVKAAFAKMRAVWESQGVSNRLETRLWDVPHEFNSEMQAAAFEWLDRQLDKK